MLKNGSIVLLCNFSIVHRIYLCRYAMRYIAMQLRILLHTKFPMAPEDDILKVVGNLLYYRYMNPAIVAPDAFDIIDVGMDNQLTPDQVCCQCVCMGVCEGVCVCGWEWEGVWFWVGVLQFFGVWTHACSCYAMRNRIGVRDWYSFIYNSIFIARSLLRFWSLAEFMC